MKDFCKLSLNAEVVDSSKNMKLLAKISKNVLIYKCTPRSKNGEAYDSFYIYIKSQNLIKNLSNEELNYISQYALDKAKKYILWNYVTEKLDEIKVRLIYSGDVDYVKSLLLSPFKLMDSYLLRPLILVFLCFLSAFFALLNALILPVLLMAFLGINLPLVKRLKKYKWVDNLSKVLLCQIEGISNECKFL